MESWEEGQTVSGTAGNYGTWEFGVYGLAHAQELRALRKELFTTRLTSFKPKLQAKYVKEFCLQFFNGIVSSQKSPFHFIL